MTLEIKNRAKNGATNASRITISALVAGLVAMITGACGQSTGSMGSVQGANIIGGTDATGNEAYAKTVVALYNTSEGSLCTASILTDSILITAAHCVAGTATDLVAIFNANLKGEDLVVRRVTLTKTTPQWATQQNAELNTGDIALAKFVGGLPSGYGPASLLTDAAQIHDGEDVTLAGYGIDNGVAGTGAEILRSVVTQIKQANYSQTEVLINQSKGKGACHGDSGGPAYLNVGGQLYLFGVTSRGVNDPNNDCSVESAYTDILAYSDFVKQTVQEFNAAPAVGQPTNPGQGGQPTNPGQVGEQPGNSHGAPQGPSGTAVAELPVPAAA